MSSRGSVVEHPTSVRRVMGLITIWSSVFFQVLCLWIIVCICYLFTDRHLLLILVETYFRVTVRCSQSISACMTHMTWHLSDCVIQSNFGLDKAITFRINFTLGAELTRRHQTNLLHCSTLLRKSSSGNWARNLKQMKNLSLTILYCPVQHLNNNKT